MESLTSHLHSRLREGRVSIHFIAPDTIASVGTILSISSEQKNRLLYEMEKETISFRGKLNSYLVVSLRRSRTRNREKNKIDALHSAEKCVDVYNGR